MEFEHLTSNNLLMFFRSEPKKIEKAAVEGIYADTPANRKLGRVGMSYTAYNEKMKGGEQKEEKEEKQTKPTKSEFLSKVKAYIKKQIDTLGKNNDYITLSTQEGCSIRLVRGAIGSKDKDIEGKFVKAFVKDPQGKIRKFDLSSYDDLVTSISNFMYDNNYTFEEIKEDNKDKKEDTTTENTKLIQAAMDKIKEANQGTAVLKGSGGLKIYLGRRKVSHWLKEFDSCSVRDSKSNILFQTRGAKDEATLIEKLTNYLTTHNIKIEED